MPTDPTDVRARYSFAISQNTSGKVFYTALHGKSKGKGKGKVVPVLN
jgi:hypothetical protein